MRWDGPILTDSGGFQVFSLAHRRKVTEQGVTFAAPIDGSKVLTGRGSMRIQVLGSDVVMIFDMPADDVDGKPVEREVREVDGAVDALGRSVRRPGLPRQADGRAVRHRAGRRAPTCAAKSAEGLKAIGFDGYAIGGPRGGRTRGRAATRCSTTAPRDAGSTGRAT